MTIPMNQPPLSENEIEIAIGKIRKGAIQFLRSRRSCPDTPVLFSHCAHGYAEYEVNATHGALELWKVLGLPMVGKTLDAFVAYYNSLQREGDGLLEDPGWKSRLLKPAIYDEGLVFFTRGGIAALKAWGKGLERPITYPLGLSTKQMLERMKWEQGAADPFFFGNLGVILMHNATLGVKGAKGQWESYLRLARELQDEESGLWIQPRGSRTRWTPHINRTFHIIKFIYNLQNRPIPRADRIIDTCLLAKDDQDYYSWEKGFACNDLDLALVLYSASRWTSHRRSEVARWARERLPMLLSVQKSDGGFSFYHDKAMDEHLMLRISPSKAESDMWGTLMYMGAINMMVAMGYPRIDRPWGFSVVHAVPHP